MTSRWLMDEIRERTARKRRPASVGPYAPFKGPYGPYNEVFVASVFGERWASQKGEAK